MRHLLSKGSLFGVLVGIASGGSSSTFRGEAEVIPLWDVLAARSRIPPAESVVGLAPTPRARNVYPLQTIATLPNANGHFLTFGDTDHDGRNEVIFWWKEFLNPGAVLHYRIMEEQGQDMYSTEYVGPNFIPMATGDLDQDGRSEIIGQLGGWVQVYESLSTLSYPTELVWSSPQMSNVVNFVAVGDTDRDGRMEIIHSENSFSGRGMSLHIFENTGDNAFAEVFVERIPDGGTGKKVLADFDGDGLMEIGFFSARVYFYESPVDNVWVRTWSDSTELQPLSDSGGGIDTDGNGRPELFVTGSTTEGWTTIVYEAVCDNTFRRITSFTQYDGGGSGVPFNTLAKLDGEAGPVSFLMNGFVHFWIHQPVSVGQWVLAAEVPDPEGGVHSGLYAYDVNRNGRDEIFWTTESVFGPETLVLEKTTVVGVDPHPASTPKRFTITPNPILTTAVIQFPMPIVAPGTQLAVYDVYGRLVQRCLHACGHDGKWTWPSGNLSSGVYFVRLEDGRGRSLGATRVTVLR